MEVEDYTIRVYKDEMVTIEGTMEVDDFTDIVTFFSDKGFIRIESYGTEVSLVKESMEERRKRVEERRQKESESEYVKLYNESQKKNAELMSKSTYIEKICEQALQESNDKIVRLYSTIEELKRKIKLFELQMSLSKSLEEQVEENRLKYETYLNTRHTFKVGDPVRVITPVRNFRFFNHQTGVIKTILEESSCPYVVDFDEPVILNEGTEYESKLLSSEFEPEDLCELDQANEIDDKESKNED